jgi:hypothetical protein
VSFFLSSPFCISITKDSRWGEIGAPVGTTLLTWIKKEWPQHGELVCYWLTTAAALAILLFATTGYILFAKHEVKTTPDNLEENIKLWAEHLGMNIGPATEPDTYFAHMLSLPNTAQPVEVFRSMKEKPGYLQFKVVIRVSKEHEAAFSKMTQDAVNRISEQLDLDIGRANLGCTFGQVKAVNDEQHKTIIVGAFLARGVPIANLNEVYFSDTYDQLTRGTGIVQASIRLAATTSQISRAQ